MLTQLLQQVAVVLGCVQSHYQVEKVASFPCYLVDVHLHWEVTLLVFAFVKKVDLALGFVQGQVQFLTAAITDSEPYQGEAVLDEHQA